MNPFNELSRLFVVALLLAGAGCCTVDAAARVQSVLLAEQRSDGRFDYLGGLRFDPAVPTPQSALGYRIGEHFTRHADMVRYLEELAASSDRVTMQQYGESHQRRSLHILTISSPDNLARLDDILARNRELAQRDLSDARHREIIENNPAIVWFSYNVHGNEPSPTETAIRVAYTLAAGVNDAIEAWLEDVVVVIDPLLNPDGHTRYVTWYENTRGMEPIAGPDAAEHDEPWPGGRTNHYLFDLNRDWIWLVHPESRSRLAVYRRYLPQLHIDFHEQGYTQPYFLGAGDDPYNVNIPAETREWIERYGDANAAVFDANGLIYSTRERFDYLYPGYGKVLPVYHGAVGMLAEQAGHSRAGLAIEVNDDYTLTLAERAHHHFLLSMSNIETTHQHRQGQLERFRQFFAEACSVEVHPKPTYVILPDTDPALLARTWSLLDAHGIEIHVLEAEQTVSDLQPYRGETAAIERMLPAKTWIVRADQPRGRLVTALFERQTEVTDPDTYDITSWPLPVAFGLHAYESAAPIRGGLQRLTNYEPELPRITGEGNVALIVDAAQHAFPRAIGLAEQHGLHARVAGEPFSIDDVEFDRGSLIVHHIRNASERLTAFESDLLEAGLSAHRTCRGITDEGPVLGANANRTLEFPKIALLRGSPLSSLSYGQIWHLLDRDVPVPYTPINLDTVSRVDLSAYNVVVVPSGRPGRALGRGADDLAAWVRKGGTLVAVAAGAIWAERSILELEPGDTEEDDDADEEADEDEDEDDARPPLPELSWEQRRQRQIEDRIPGTALSAVIDRTHPLAAGMGEWVGVIKRGGRRLTVADETIVVAQFDAEPRIGGSISDRQLDRLAGTPLVTIHSLGRGRVICFAEDPTLRGFQHNAMRLLLNAIVLGPSL